MAQIKSQLSWMSNLIIESKTASFFPLLNQALNMFHSAEKLAILTLESMGICSALELKPSGQLRNYKFCDFKDWLQQGSALRHETIL